MATTSAPDSALVAAIRTALGGAGDPVRAAGQQAYMKSEMPYRGITSPELRALLRPLLGDAALAPSSRTAWSQSPRTSDSHAVRDEGARAASPRRGRSRARSSGEVMPR